jgi:hypothetical protein
VGWVISLVVVAGAGAVERPVRVSPVAPLLPVHRQPLPSWIHSHVTFQGRTEIQGPEREKKGLLHLVLQQFAAWKNGSWPRGSE